MSTPLMLKCVNGKLLVPSADAAGNIRVPPGSEVGHNMPGPLPIGQLLTSTIRSITQAPEENALQSPSVGASDRAVPKHWDARHVGQGSRHVGQGSHQFKMTKVAEALDEVDEYDPKTVVRVNGLRGLGEEGISILSRYLNKHFGSVMREVPVISFDRHGRQRLSNFGFIVMSCAAEAQQIIARDTLSVECHEITVRAYSARHTESHTDSQRSKEANRQDLEEFSVWEGQLISL